MPEAIDALVISLKMLLSCGMLLRQPGGSELVATARLQTDLFQILLYFDSTAKGNIGPVTDALMDALDTPFTVFSALPVNGRTVYQGYLFVMNQLLAESECAITR